MVEWVKVIKLVYGFNQSGYTTEEINLKEDIAHNYFKCSFNDLNKEQQNKVLTYLKWLEG